MKRNEPLPTPPSITASSFEVVKPKIAGDGSSEGAIRGHPMLEEVVGGGGGGFMANFNGHLDEFVSTPMDQYRICLKRTMQDFREFVKLKKSSFGSAKVDAEGGAGAKDVASSPPVKDPNCRIQVDIGGKEEKGALDLCGEAVEIWYL